MQPTDATSVASADVRAIQREIIALTRDHPPASLLAAAAGRAGGVPAASALLAQAFRTKTTAKKNAPAKTRGPSRAGKSGGKKSIARASGQGGGKNSADTSGAGLGLRAAGSGKRGAG
jgi:hypothetical protein